MKKSCVRLFRHRQTLFRRNRPLLLPAFLLLRLRLHGQAGKPPFMNLPRRLLRAHAFCVPGGRIALLCTRSKMTAAPALAVSKIAGEKTKTGGENHEKIQSVLSQRTVVFSCCGAESCCRRGALHSGGMALPWRLLFVSGAFAAEKIKQKASPGGEKSAGAAILCGARSYSRQSNEISTKKRYVYVNETNQPHCCDPL